MLFMYQLSIGLYDLIVRIISPFNPKAKKFFKGRKNWRNKLTGAIENNPGKWVWFHAASLGEFEQGRPVIEALKDQHPDIKILLTFFSPSGYEVRNNYEKADYICYLPLDTPAAAKYFVQTVQPAVAVFIKYEFWYYYLKYLELEKVPILMISCIFRENQLFFHPAGRFYHKALKRINHFFVQDEKSQRLISDIGIQNTTVSGDTRFDRVVTIAQDAKDIPIAASFTKDNSVMVLGSTWPSCMEHLTPFIHHYKGSLKFIIAPHNISEPELAKLESDFENCIRYSKAEAENVSKFEVLIIDNIGMLSSLYRYGDFAYVGGAFRGALHNTLEAAVYGIPVCFGEHMNNQKFIEAIELVAYGGGFTFRSFDELDVRFKRLMENEVSYKRMARASGEFVKSRTGATEKVMAKISELL